MPLLSIRSLFAIVTLAVGAHAAAQQTVVMRISHQVPPAHHMTRLLEAFAADVDPDTAAVMAAAQRPYAAAAFAATPSAPPAWNTLPCWYLLGTEDKAIPPALQRFMAERANATIVEIPASHVSFVSQPEAATELILQAVEATTATA